MQDDKLRKRCREGRTFMRRGIEARAQKPEKDVQNAIARTQTGQALSAITQFLHDLANYLNDIVTGRAA